MAYPSALTLSTRGEGFRLTLHCRLKLQSPSCVAVKEMSTGSLQGREGRGGEREGRGRKGRGRGGEGRGVIRTIPLARQNKAVLTFRLVVWFPSWEKHATVQSGLCSGSSAPQSQSEMERTRCSVGILSPMPWNLGEGGEEVREGRKREIVVQLVNLCNTSSQLRDLPNSMDLKLT